MVRISRLKWICCSLVIPLVATVLVGTTWKGNTGFLGSVESRLITGGIEETINLGLIPSLLQEDEGVQSTRSETPVLIGFECISDAISFRIAGLICDVANFGIEHPGCRGSCQSRSGQQLTCISVATGWKCVPPDRNNNPYYQCKRAAPNDRCVLKRQVFNCGDKKKFTCSQSSSVCYLVGEPCDNTLNLTGETDGECTDVKSQCTQ